MKIKPYFLRKIKLKSRLLQFLFGALRVKYSIASKSTETNSLTCLTIFRLEIHFKAICKQCRPKSDAAKCGFLSGLTLLAYTSFYKIKVETFTRKASSK